MTDPIMRLRELVSLYQAKPSSNLAHDIAGHAPAVIRHLATDPQPPALVAAGDTVTELLAKAEATSGTRAAKLGARIRALLAELKPLVDQAEKERTLRKTVEVLEKQLRTTREELRGLAKTPKATPARSGGPVVYSEIRAWAAANDISCPKVGVVPKRIVDAYLTAQAGRG